MTSPKYLYGIVGAVVLLILAVSYYAVQSDKKMQVPIAEPTEDETGMMPLETRPLADGGKVETYAGTYAVARAITRPGSENNQDAVITLENGGKRRELIVAADKPVKLLARTGSGVPKETTLFPEIGSYIGVT